MSLSIGTSSSSSGPRAKCDQVIFEAMAKAAEVIVNSRRPSPYSSNLSARFNLCVPEIAEVRQALQHHRQSLHLPLRLEVRYKNQQLVERWSLEYTLQKTQPLYGDSIAQLRHVCKKIVIWLRTLYCWTRMLPSFALRGSDLFYRLEVCEGLERDVPQFSFMKSPGVSTPYGILQYKIWYDPRITKPTTKPIPIVSSVNKLPSPTILLQSKSLPMRGGNHLLSHHSNNLDNSSLAFQEPSSFDQSRLLHRASSNLENEKSSKGGTLECSYSLERSNSGNISRRAALHDPPTYAYNHTPSHTTGTSNTPDTKTQAPLSSSPAMYFCSTPPTVPSMPPLSSTPPTTMGFLLPLPAGVKLPTGMVPTTKPPFSGLPHELAAAAGTTTRQQENNKPDSELPPISSLDLLHSSPFNRTAAGGMMSSAFSSFMGSNEAEWLRSSTMPAVDCKKDNEEDEDDMPFAVDDEDSDGSVGIGDIRFTAKYGTPRLSLLETNNSSDEDALQSLAQQLQEFKSYGATLTASLEQ